MVESFSQYFLIVVKGGSRNIANQCHNDLLRLKTFKFFISCIHPFEILSQLLYNLVEELLRLLWLLLLLLWSHLYEFLHSVEVLLLSLRQFLIECLFLLLYLFVGLFVHEQFKNRPFRKFLLFRVVCVSINKISPLEIYKINPIVYVLE